MDFPDNTGRWYEQEGDDAGKIVYDLGTQLESDQRNRKETQTRMKRMYTGDTGIVGMSRPGQVELELNYNLSRAASDTVHAEIAGRQKPTGKFQTNDADWKTKRKAKKMEKFCTVERCASFSARFSASKRPRTWRSCTKAWIRVNYYIES